MRRRLRTFAALAFASTAFFCRSRGARADEERLDAARLPAPFALPALTHDRLDVRVDAIVGRVTPSDPARPYSAAGIFRPSIEGTGVVPRQLYLGLAWPIAGALPPDGGLTPGELGRASGVRTFVGNLEASVRAVFPLPEALEIGFILAATAPTATYDRDSRGDRSAVEALGSLDPTRYVEFLDDRIGLRPAGDLRVVRGSLVLQGRHGIDILIDARGRDSVKIAGRLILHLGWLLRPDLELSAEATQYYFFSSDDPVSPTGLGTPQAAFAERYRISDGHRSAFTLGPGLHVAFPEVDVGVGLMTNLYDPLSAGADRVFGLNLSLVGHAGRSRRIKTAD